MARKKYQAFTLALAAIAPAVLAGCGGSPTTPTLSASTPGANSPITGTVSAGTATSTGDLIIPTEVPTAVGNAPLPQGTGVPPAALPTTQP